MWRVRTLESNGMVSRISRIPAWKAALVVCLSAGLAVGCGRDEEESTATADSGGFQPTDVVGGDILADTTIPMDLSEPDAGRQDTSDAKDAGRADTGRADVGAQDTADVAPDVLPDVLPDVSDVSAPDVTDVGPDTKPVDAGPPPDGVAEDVGAVDGYFWVRITDNAQNSSVLVCLDVYASPGADIDAVALYRAGELLGYADTVKGMLNTDPHMTGNPCKNDYEDLDDALGEPDAEAEVGSVSLNGGYLLLRFEGAPEILEGDFISVFEAGTGSIGVPESYRVEIGPTDDVDGLWTPLGDLHVGDQDIEVDF